MGGAKPELEQHLTGQVGGLSAALLQPIELGASRRRELSERAGAGRSDIPLVVEAGGQVGRSVSAAAPAERPCGRGTD